MKGRLPIESREHFLFSFRWPLTAIGSATKSPVATQALTFQELLLRLQSFWAERGCVLAQPYDVEVGAGTMSPDTFLRVLGPDP